MLGPAARLEQVGDESRQALVLLGGLDARPPGEPLGQRNGDVLHDTDIMFSCFCVKYWPLNPW